MTQNLPWHSPESTRKLVEIIKDNPGSKFVIDNDCWSMYATERDEDDEPIARGDGSYGYPILLALAELAGIEVDTP